MRVLPASVAALLIVAGTPPLVAQVQDQVVTVYGDDKCPASNGQEIVICKRAPRNEQFRIPKDLRESEAPPQALGGQALAAMQTTGGDARQVQSCSAVGAGVGAGCLKQQADAWKAKQRADQRDEASIP